MSNIVSVIIPLYNREELIVETLQSLLNQTFNNWEAIVVDDGSTDNSYNVVDEISKKEPRIKLLKRNREPKGAPTCRNIGIKESSGNFIMFLDSDDILALRCLENRIDVALVNKQYDFWVFNCMDFYETPGDKNTIWNIDKEEKDLIRFFQLDAPWSTSDILWEKSIIKQLNGFLEDAIAWQDWELHIRALLETLKYKKFKIIDNYIRISNKDRMANWNGDDYWQKLIEFNLTFYKTHIKTDKYNLYFKRILFFLLSKFKNKKYVNQYIRKTFYLNLADKIIFLLYFKWPIKRGRSIMVRIIKKILRIESFNCMINQTTMHSIEVPEDYEVLK